MPLPGDASIDDPLLERYVLGQLPEDEADRLDRASIEDDEIAARLRLIEVDLVDAYARRALERDKLIPFESHYLGSPRRRGEVRLAEAFLGAVDRAAAGVRASTDAAPRRHSAERYQVFTVRNRAERRSGAAALLVGAAAAALLWAWRSGAGGAVWCYPLVVAAFMMLPVGSASVFSVGLLASAAAFVSRSAGADVALRFALSLGLVIAIVASMLRTVEDLHQRLREQAITDPLTGAFNRRHLDACLAMAIERRNRTGEPASLLLLDVDHFKAINDAFGHPAGDEVLRTIVGVIGGRMRTLDVLFRIGGEEFALLLAGARHVDALAVGEDLRLLVEDSRPIEGGAVSISIGVSELQRGMSAYGWLADADAALYRAKRGGRNRVAGRPLASAS